MSRSPRLRSRSRSRASVAPEIPVYRVTGDGKPRAGNVVLAQVRQRVLKFAPPFGIGARDSLRPQAGLPHAEEPDPIQTHLDQTIQFGVRNIIQRGGAAQFLGQFRQPDASRRGCE